MSAPPWMKFFPADWRSDPCLRMCSLAARGLWMEMLCLMHEADPYGTLLVNKRPISDAQLASLCGVTSREVINCLAELEDAGVFSRDANGSIFSRRMRQDRAKAESDKANGQRGGNPNLRVGVNPPDNGPYNGGHKAQSQSPESEDNADDRPRENQHSLLSEEAFAITERILKIQGLHPEDPRAIGTAYVVQSWLTNHWDSGAIIQGVEMVMARRLRGAPNGPRYFERAIAQVIADRNRSLPTAEPPDASISRQSVAKSGSIMAAAAALRQELERRAEQEECQAQSVDHSSGGEVIRLLPARSVS